MLFFLQKPPTKTQNVYMYSTWRKIGQNGGKRLQK